MKIIINAIFELETKREYYKKIGTEELMSDDEIIEQVKSSDVLEDYIFDSNLIEIKEVKLED